MNQITGVSLSSDIVDLLIRLDSLLELAATDEQDTAELAERLNALPASEIRHILNLLLARGIVLAASEAPAVPVAVVASEEVVPSNV
jgi:hypothetical protein